MRITIIGAGKMGRGIGTRAVAGGHEVEIIDNDPADARALADDLGGSAAAGEKNAITGEVVVLAVYYPATLGAIEEYGEQLAGKVVVDISNPIDFDTMDGLAVSPDSSGAEEAARALPSGTSVVKAFNTTFGNTLAAGEVAGQKLDVFIAADDDDAKGKVTALVESAGLRPIDAGPLRRSRQLEHMMFLHILVQEPLGTDYQSAIKILP